MKHCTSCSIAGVALAFLLAGCGPSTGDVSGVVKYKGKPPAGSTITFFDERNGAPSSLIADDGSYSVKAVAVGTAKIAIVSPQAISMPGIPQTTFHKVPEKYFDKEQSGLTFKVTGGSHTHNIDLE